MEPMKPMEPMEPMKPMEPMQPMTPQKPWWPGDLGQPSSSGSQNDTRYAYFAESNRLVVDSGKSVRTYDTGGRSIHGFGQQQSGGSAMTFDSDRGPVELGSLKTVA